MAEVKTPRTITRRRFLQLTGGAVGGTALIVYGGQASSGNTGSPVPLPNGYQFFRVFRVNTAFPDVTPGVMVNDSSHILFHGESSAFGGTAVRGVYQLAMSYAGGVPSVQNVSKVVQVGDILSDGRRVSRIAAGDTNALGSYVTVIDTYNTGQAPAPTTTTSGVYIRHGATGSLASLVQHTDPTPDGGQFGAIFGDVALQDNDSTLLTAFYTQGTQNLQGQFLLQNSTSSEIGSLILRSGQLLPQSNATITSFGLVDIASDGFYATQVNATPRGRRGRDRHRRQDGLDASALLNGHISRLFFPARLLAASSELRPRQRFAGDTILGPRVGPRNTVAFVTHQSTAEHRLTYRASPIRATLMHTGAPAGDGSKVLSIGPPVVSPDCLTYYVQITENAYTELYVSNGVTTQLLLSSLDTIANASAPITEIMLGYHPKQVDSAGRIVFTAEFLENPNAPLDPSSISTWLVVGIPV